MDEIDEQIANWRDTTKEGRVSACPAFANIPSKVFQVAAVRVLAHQRRQTDEERGFLIASVRPGVINTPTSALGWDVSTAPTPAEAAKALLDLALDPVKPEHHGELVRDGEVLPFSRWVGPARARPGRAASG